MVYIFTGGPHPPPSMIIWRCATQMIAILFVTPTYANQIRFHLRSKHGKPLAMLNRSSLLPALHCAPLAIWSSVFHATAASARGPSASKRFWCRWCCSIYKRRHRALLRLPLISTKVLIPSSKVQLSFLIFLDLLLNPLWIRFSLQWVFIQSSWNYILVW